MDCYNTIERPVPYGASFTASGPEEQPRRHACNRCRAYKIRCERQVTPDARQSQKCRRCMKARVPCTTSPAQKMGRPRNNASSQDSTTFNLIEASCDTQLCINDATSASYPGYGLQDKDAASQIEYNENYAISSRLAGSRTKLPSDAQRLRLDGPSSAKSTRVSEDVTRDTTIPQFRMEDCHLDSLLELNEDLLKQFHTLRLFDNSNGHPAQHHRPTRSSPSIDPSKHFLDLGDPINSIGSILHSSQRLLDILRPLLRASQSSLSPTHFYPTTDQHDSSDRQASISLSPFTLSPDPFFPTPPTSSTLDAPPSTFPSLQHHLPNNTTQSDSSDSSSSSEHILRLDFPTTMAFMSAFTTLSRTYRILFTRIESTLRQQQSHASSSSSLPRHPSPEHNNINSLFSSNALLTHVNLDGFGIEQDSKLQVKVLLQVCTHMSEQVESGIRALLVAGTGGVRGGGSSPIVEESSQMLFETVCRQEALDGEGESDGRRSGEGLSLRAKAGHIRQLMEVVKI